MRKPEGPPCASCGGMDHARRSSRKCPLNNRASNPLPPPPVEQAVTASSSSAQPVLLSTPHHNGIFSNVNKEGPPSNIPVHPVQGTATTSTSNHYYDTVDKGTRRDSGVGFVDDDDDDDDDGGEEEDKDDNIAQHEHDSSIQNAISTELAVKNSLRKPRAKNGQGTRTIRREEELQNAKLIECPIKRTRAFNDGIRTIIHKARMLEKTTDCMVCMCAGSIDTLPETDASSGCVTNYTSQKLEQVRERGYFVDSDGNPINLPENHTVQLVENAKSNIETVIGIYQTHHHSKKSNNNNNNNNTTVDDPDDIVREERDDASSLNIQAQKSLLHAREESLQRAEQDRLRAEYSLKRDREEFEQERQGIMHQLELDRAKLAQERKFLLESTARTSPLSPSASAMADRVNADSQ